MDMDVTVTLTSQYCQFVDIFSKSAAGWFWAIVTFLWPWYWLGILTALGLWTFIEIYFGVGTSENGFSPTYNRVVGSGMYLLFQWLAHLCLVALFGELVYCRPWSLIVHYGVFLLTGGFLHVIHFWPYWRIPFVGKVRLY